MLWFDDFYKTKVCKFYFRKNSKKKISVKKCISTFFFITLSGAKKKFWPLLGPVSCADGGFFSFTKNQRGGFRLFISQ